MRSLATHLLAAIVGAVIALAFAWPSTRTIPANPPPTPVRDRLPATEPRASISPPASPIADKQATPFRVIPLDVDGSANELARCRALQAKIGGELERGVGKGPSYGRVDLLIWQAGIGQSVLAPTNQARHRCWPWR